MPEILREILGSFIFYLEEKNFSIFGQTKLFFLSMICVSLGFPSGSPGGLDRRTGLML